MSISRSLIALGAVATLALAGCSAAGEPESTPEPTAPADAAAPEADLKDVPDVVATVNDEEIGLEDFTQAYEAQLQQASMMQQQGGEEVDQDALKQQTADLLVNNTLLTQAAAGSGIEASDEDIDAVLQQIADQNGLGSVDEVIEAFGDQGLDEDAVREQAEGQFLVDAYVEQEADVQEPSEEELKKQYDELVEQAKSQGAEDQVPEYEEAKQQLADQAVSEGQSAAIEDILKKLREGADVDVKL